MNATQIRSGLLSMALVLALIGCDSSEKAPPPVPASQLQANFENAIARGDDEAALVVSNTLKQRYPGSAESAAVRAKVPEVQARVEARHAEAKAAAERSAKEAREKSAAQLKTLLTRMNRKRDQVEHVTWYQPKSNPVRSEGETYATLYVGLSDEGTVWLRTRMQYGGSDWIFFDKLKFSIDGTTLPAQPLGLFSVERDNADGDVWEWVDLAVEDDGLSLMDKLASGKTVIVRFEGKYYKDLKMSDAMKRSMRDTLELYRLLNSGLRPPEK